MRSFISGGAAAVIGNNRWLSEFFSDLSSERGQKSSSLMPPPLTISSCAERIFITAAASVYLQKRRRLDLEFVLKVGLCWQICDAIHIQMLV